MFKRVIGVLLLLVLVIVLIVGVRTSRVQPVAVQVPAVAAVALDEAGAVQRFVGAIRIPTESVYGQPPNAEAIGKLPRSCRATCSKTGRSFIPGRVATRPPLRSS
jgi:hypothetical protein